MNGINCMLRYVLPFLLCSLSTFSQVMTTLYLIETTFNAFAIITDPDQTAPVPDQDLLCLRMEI